MKTSIEESEVKTDTTITTLMDEFQLASAPILPVVSGEFFIPMR